MGGDKDRRPVMATHVDGFHRTKGDSQMVAMQRFVSIAMVGFVLIGGVAPLQAADSVTVKLEPQSSSSESGTATLTKSGDKQTKVVLNLEGAPSSAQPVHIHKGTCDKLDPKPAYPLSPVVGGKSETTVNASLDSLEKGGYAINGHKSAQDVATYVFCGPIGSM